MRRTLLNKGGTYGYIQFQNGLICQPHPEATEDKGRIATTGVPVDEMDPQNPGDRLLQLLLPFIKTWKYMYVCPFKRSR